MDKNTIKTSVIAGVIILFLIVACGCIGDALIHKNSQNTLPIKNNNATQIKVNTQTK